MLAAGNLRVQKNSNVNPTGPVEEYGRQATCHLVAQPGLVRALLESRADANARTESGSTALHIACANCIVAHVALLLEHDADVNATDACGMSPLMQVVGTSKLATDKTRLACIEILAASGKLEARDHLHATDDARRGSLTPKTSPWPRLAHMMTTDDL
jgi:ankyrin repeat protein